jgi:hypothetical protein
LPDVVPILRTSRSPPSRPAGPLLTGHFEVGTLIDKVPAGIMVYPFIIDRHIA